MRTGRYLWVVVDLHGNPVEVGYAKHESDHMMRANNGKGRGWRVVRYVREPVGTKCAECGVSLGFVASYCKRCIGRAVRREP